MMDDRQLLEAAAKAAGMPEYWKYVDSRFGLRPPIFKPTEKGWWNPLTDHGDRYRLARDMKLTIDFQDGSVYTELTENKVRRLEYFNVGDDKSEAYAIVRAAAEMGK